MSAFEPPGGNGNGNGHANTYSLPQGQPPPQQHQGHQHPGNHGPGNDGMSMNHPGHVQQPQYMFDGQQQQGSPHIQHLQHPHQNPYNGHPNAHDLGDGQHGMQGPGPAAPTPTSGGEGQKGNRLRKACDSCSIRKVKCDESGPPCRACAALDIPCTRERPSRRRGPPNRHAEAIKRRRLESPSGAGGNFSSPTSPNNIAATLVSISSHAVLNAESICPFSTLELLVDDFFTYIHPLTPFPHEPSFRAAFKHREDLNNPAFLALLASMVGALVASFPRKPRIHLKAERREHLFPNSISLVERCHKVAVEARGSGYLDKDLTVYDAATSYFLGLSAAYTFNWRQCRLYFGETLTMVRVLGAHKVKDPGLLVVGDLPTVFGETGGDKFDGSPQPIDCIRQEIGRRIFWCMFVGIRSMQQLGASFGELLIPPSTPNDPYPPMPLEVDDEYIFVDHIAVQPHNVLSKITGFNAGIKIYLTVSPLATMEMAYGIDQVFDWNRQKRVLEECLKNVKKTLDGIAPELHVAPQSKAPEFGANNTSYFPPVPEYMGARANATNGAQWQPEGSMEARRNLQFEIQKANIYASQLGTRSYIVEKYLGLQELQEQRDQSSASPSVMSSPGLMAAGLDGIIPKKSPTSNYDGYENVVAERELIVKDLLVVLNSINQVNMEPNGGSFINKIRQIASTLISTPAQRKGPVAQTAEAYLNRFLDILMRLERVSPGVKSETGEVTDEEELRAWADMRENQMRFAQAGGFLSEM
ncbi:hypothetical protein HYFRA_00013551 [Hymenoscyphus fraxineus]|uniref:Zn(2)-C6 fungal-type domain-containing protein n=1 Tax=Hymenoscyphus fraxineus TaxID=746836 RepID=A0A9N9LD36_9HELO|nr:hypothetical protein HYFRA_00013551 [Hymenoscyphus fraxineus]